MCVWCLSGLNDFCGIVWYRTLRVRKKAAIYVQFPSCGCAMLATHLLHEGLVHPLKDATLHQSPPLPSVQCCPAPGSSFLLCNVILPPPAWSSSGSFPSPGLPFCAPLGPSSVLQSRYVFGPFPFPCLSVIYHASCLRSPSCLRAWCIILWFYT